MCAGPCCNQVIPRQISAQKVLLQRQIERCFDDKLHLGERRRDSKPNLVIGHAANGARSSAAAFSLGAQHNGSAPASPGPARETAAPASAPTFGAEVTASKRVEATSVDTDRASTASDVTSGGKSNVATTCEASGAACGVLVGRGDAPNETGAGGAWTNVPETPAPATSPRPALEHTKPVASQRSAAAADRPNTKLGRPYAGDGSSGHNGFWAWSR
jgi:hypothetical protein